MSFRPVENLCIWVLLSNETTLIALKFIRLAIQSSQKQSENIEQFHVNNVAGQTLQPVKNLKQWTLFLFQSPCSTDHNKKFLSFLNPNEDNHYYFYIVLFTL